MNETMLIFGNEDVTNKCIVVQTSTDVLMKSKDPNSVKPNLEVGDFVDFNSIKVEVKDCSAFFCDLGEISEMTVKEVQKRDLMHPL